MFIEEKITMVKMNDNREWSRAEQRFRTSATVEKLYAIASSGDIAFHAFVTFK